MDLQVTNCYWASARSYQNLWKYITLNADTMHLILDLDLINSSLRSLILQSQKRRNKLLFPIVSHCQTLLAHWSSRVWFTRQTVPNYCLIFLLRIPCPKHIHIYVYNIIQYGLIWYTCMQFVYKGLIFSYFLNSSSSQIALVPPMQLLSSCMWTGPPFTYIPVYIPVYIPDLVLKRLLDNVN